MPIVKPAFKLRDILPARSSLSAYNGAINALDEIIKMGVGTTMEYINSSGTIRNHGTTVVNSNITDLILKLGNGIFNGAVKEIILENKSGHNVIVQTPRGSFRLNSSNSYRKLMYVNGVWKILSNNNSYYPSIQHTIPMVGLPYTGINIGQGSSVALSASGDTLIIGAPGDNVEIGPIGCAFVYINNPHDGTWSQQTKLVGENVIGHMSGQGFSVTLSADSNTIAVGAPTDRMLSGSVWIWTRMKKNDGSDLLGVWTMQQKILSENHTELSMQGTSVSLSANGDILAVGSSGKQF